jgi:hypothetical protein
LAAAEELGEPVHFAGTCPDCRKDDPFLKMMDEVPGISTATKLFAKKPHKEK